MCTVEVVKKESCGGERLRRLEFVVEAGYGCGKSWLQRLEIVEDKTQLVKNVMIPQKRAKRIKELIRS